MDDRDEEWFEYAGLMIEEERDREDEGGSGCGDTGTLGCLAVVAVTGLIVLALMILAAGSSPG